MNIVNKLNFMRCLFLFLIFLLICGCATYKTSSNSVVAGSTHILPSGLKNIENSYWWRCQFIIEWPDGEEPDWAVDHLLAHAVVSPVLAQFANRLPYWRFHRRAVRDRAGHKFSFIFYSKPEIASTVFTAINNSGILKDSIEAELVKKVYIDNPENPQNQNISATSDPNWSPEIQKHWPAFIMGVSSFWLGLIIEDMQRSSKEFDDIHLLLAKYREVNSNINDKWRNEGQHAFFHHMSAIFGYQPMLIKKELRF